VQVGSGGCTRCAVGNTAGGSTAVRADSSERLPVPGFRRGRRAGQQAAGAEQEQHDGAVDAAGPPRHGTPQSVSPGRGSTCAGGAAASAAASGCRVRGWSRRGAAPAAVRGRSAARPARVGHRQPGRGLDEVPVDQQVEIDETGALGDLPLPTQRVLHVEQQLEQAVCIEQGLELEHTVQEPGWSRTGPVGSVS